jgi:hypothetical protein
LRRPRSEVGGDALTQLHDRKGIRVGGGSCFEDLPRAPLRVIEAESVVPALEAEDRSVEPLKRRAGQSDVTDVSGLQ